MNEAPVGYSATSELSEIIWLVRIMHTISVPHSVTNMILTAFEPVQWNLYWSGHEDGLIVVACGAHLRAYRWRLQTHIVNL